MNNYVPLSEKQNDNTALTLYKASYRCMRNERIAKYVMLVLSFGICIAAILNKYLPQMAPNVENIESIQETAATYINLISGVILVLGLIIGFYANRMHTEGTVLRDRYEAYVFDNPPNLSILRPIAQTVINVYSHKTHKPEDAYKNVLFAPDENPDPATAQFNYINNEAHSDYRLYLSIQPFFLTLWIGFCVLIIILAVTFNDAFVTTLINIMIPSLSAITTIGNSWYNCRLQMRQLQNLLTVIDQIQRLPEHKYREYITDKRNIRALADGLYNYRASAFVIPNFLVRRNTKRNLEQNITLPTRPDKNEAEMPTLMLPEVAATTATAAKTNKKAAKPATVKPVTSKTLTPKAPVAKTLAPKAEESKPVVSHDQAAVKPATVKPAATHDNAVVKPATTKPVVTREQAVAKPAPVKTKAVSAEKTATEKPVKSKQTKPTIKK